MATKKSNNRMNNTQSTTKVLCSACGAEIIIPANQHPVSGMAIGKDSGLGTVVLPTTGGGAECMAYGCTSPYFWFNFFYYRFSTLYIMCKTFFN